jgi:metal-responsive CopG/Arc/MetJ family transcriptional regulator
MAKEKPERLTISIPENEPIDAETIDELVGQSECGNRSEFIRELLKEAVED